jgi:hypothetical protein
MREWHYLGKLGIRWAYIPVKGWWPYLTTEGLREDMVWMIEWRRLWIAWGRVAR